MSLQMKSQGSKMVVLIVIKSSEQYRPTGPLVKCTNIAHHKIVCFELLLFEAAFNNIV